MAVDLNDHFDVWQRDQTPQNAATVLEHASPAIDKAITTVGGQVSALTRGMGKRIVLDAMASYKPGNDTKFSSWTQTQLQRLHRPVRHSKFTVRVPDMRAHEAVRVRGAIAELQAETGYEPSDGQIADKLGMPLKRIRSARTSSTPEIVTQDLDAHPEAPPDETQLVHDMVYHGLAGRDQVIMEHVFGYNGVKPIPAQDVAKKLGISPAAVSQRVAKIRGMLQSAEGVV